MPFEVKPAFPSWSFLEGGSPLLPRLFQGQLMPNPKIDAIGAEPLDAAGDQLGARHPVRPYLPCLAQCDPKIASGVMVLGARGRETQVRLTKCRAFTFSVVILPPQVPQASDNV